jgi:hypothetical protein
MISLRHQERDYWRHIRDIQIGPKQGNPLLILPFTFALLHTMSKTRIDSKSMGHINFWSTLVLTYHTQT